jgi:hypothetical protein
MTMDGTPYTLRNLASHIDTAWRNLASDIDTAWRTVQQKAQIGIDMVCDADLRLVGVVLLMTAPAVGYAALMYKLGEKLDIPERWMQPRIAPKKHEGLTPKELWNRLGQPYEDAVKNDKSK